MHEFETFVYLDVRKTGSTFINVFLRRFSAEEEVCRRTHKGMPADCDRNKFYFISVRHPLEQYLSLYAFGCQQKGQLFGTLRKKGCAHFYDRKQAGFRVWLDFVLREENAGLLGDGYGRHENVSELVGLQTYRVLKLALPSASRRLRKCRSREDARAAYNEHNLASYTIRTESLRADLKELVRTRLQGRIRNVDAAIRFIDQEPARNASPRMEDEITLDANQKRRIEEREWLLYEIFFNTSQERHCGGV
jgi:hypothetical protein